MFSSLHLTNEFLSSMILLRILFCIFFSPPLETTQHNYASWMFNAFETIFILTFFLCMFNLKVVDCRICGDPHSRLRFAFVEFADDRKLVSLG